MGSFDISIEVVALPATAPLAPALISARTSDFDEVHPMSFATESSKKPS